MSDKFFPDISVGDFAADILKSMSKDPNGLKPALKESTVQSSNAPDISKISVSNDFVSLVVEGKKPKKQTKLVESQEEDPELRLGKLLINLSNLITEAKQLVKECGTTMTGNIGVNMAGTANKPSKSNKKNLANALKAMLKAR